MSRPGDKVLLRALHIAVIVAFAFAQPLFDLLGRYVDFLVAHRMEGRALVLLAAALCPGLPLLLGLVGAALLLLPERLGGALHAGLIALFGAAVALPVLARLEAVPAALAAAGALALGSALGLGYVRARSVSLFLSVLTPALLVFPAVFLLTQPVRGLLAPAPEVPAGEATARPIPVVVLIFDALSLYHLLDPSESIDAELYPNFAALAGRAHWFRNATSVAVATNLAVPALLAGRYPDLEKASTARDYPRNLFTLLAGSHEMNVVEPVTHLCPEEVCAGGPRPLPSGVAADLFYVSLHVLLPAEWTVWLPRVDATWKDFSAPPALDPEEAKRELREHWFDANWLFDRFLAGIGDTARPGLHFAHLNVPHLPYLYLPSGASYRPLGSPSLAPPRGRIGRRWTDDPWAITQALQRQLLQVRFADHLLGRLLERLRQTGLLDRALLVVASDHGLVIQPGRRDREISDDTVGEVLSVPLLVKLPGQTQGRVSDANVETIDVLPTILATLDLLTPAELDGRPLAEADRPEREAKLAFTPSGEGPRLVEHRFGRELPGRAARVRRIRQRFDLSGGAEGLFAVGPHRDWLGRPAESFPRAPESLYQVALDDAEAFRSVDRDSGLVPARVAGVLSNGDLAKRLAVAISLNGKIRATGYTYDRRRRRARFSAMLPESAFRSGENALEILVVRERDGELALAPARPREVTVNDRLAAVRDP